MNAAEVFTRGEGEEPHRFECDRPLDTAAVVAAREETTVYNPAKGYPRIVPYILYRDAGAASRWLCEVFGLRERIRFATPDGQVRHAELEAGGFIVSLGQRGGRFGEVSSITLIFVDDVDRTSQRALAAGGSIVSQATDQPWGLRQAVVADPEGQRWEISQHLRDVPPEEWGARQLGPMPG